LAERWSYKQTLS